MTRHLRRLGYRVNRKHIQRLMRLMGLKAIYPKPKTSRPHPEHKTYPYLLRDLTIDHPIPCSRCPTTWVHPRGRTAYKVF